MKGIIYKYTSPSGKCYIGQTTQENKRQYIFFNVNQSYGSPKINNARKKYDPKSFEYEVLFEHTLNNIDELREILGEKEKFYINKYDSINNGYNHQEGGLYTVNIITPESRRQGALKMSKTVMQYSIEGKFIKEWLSTMDIERELGINHTLISQNCLCKTSHCREYIFKYKLDGNTYDDLVLQEQIKVHKTKSLKICQLDSNGNEINRWKTITEASKELHMCRHNLKKLAESGKEYKQFTYKLIE